MIQSLFITQPLTIDDSESVKEGVRKFQRDILGSITQISGWIGSDTDYLFDILIDRPTFALIGVLALRYGFEFRGTVPYRDGRIILVFQRTVPDA